ncbi:mucin-13b [Antennarius striatus]|uniref:mucin-13b n=1 Tax=Antennarius striatus TaxID=241820 RepID=UPI0035B26970
MLKIFSTSDYFGCRVLELRPAESSRRSEQAVNATVEILFTPTASTKTEEVVQKIEKYIVECPECILSGGSFSDFSLCDMVPCDKNTMECHSENGSFNCTCFNDYAKTNLSSRICIICPSGQQAVDFACVDCPYGYSGFNCDESWMLTVIVVCTIFGVLLLLIIILLPIMLCRSSKKNKKNKNADNVPLVSNGLSNGREALANTPTNIGIPRIPRAATNISWDSKTNLEMTQTNNQRQSFPHMYEDQDDMTPYARSKSGLHGQTERPNNPYTQNPSQQMNSASRNGQVNPYYVHDNGRQFN